MIATIVIDSVVYVHSRNCGQCCNRMTTADDYGGYLLLISRFLILIVIVGFSVDDTNEGKNTGKRPLLGTFSAIVKL